MGRLGFKRIIQYFHPLLLIPILLFAAGIFLLLFSTQFQLKLLGLGITILSVVIAGLIVSTTVNREIEARRPSYGLPSKVQITTQIDDKSEVIRQQFGNIGYINDSSDILESKTENIQKKKFSLADSLIKTFLNPKKKTTPKKSKIKPKVEINQKAYSEIELVNPPDEGFKVRGPIKSTIPKEVQLPITEKKSKQYRDSELDFTRKKGEKEVTLKVNTTETTFIKETSIDNRIKSKETIEELDLSKQKTTESEFFHRQSFQVDLSEIISSDYFDEIKILDLMRKRLTDVLKVIPAVTNTQTAVFFLFNSAKNLLLLQSVITEHQQLIDRQRKYYVNGDLLSQILRSGQPEIITNLNPNAIKDLIPYYLNNIEVGSFIGIPVFYNQKIVGLLCADSKIDGAYDEYAVNFLLYLSKILVFYLENFFQRTEIQLDSNILNHIAELRNLSFSKEIEFELLIKNLISFVFTNFSFITVGIAILNIDTGDYVIFDVKSKYDFDSQIVKKKVKMGDTFLGNVITSKKIMIRRISSQKIRVHPNETRLKDGIFFGIPILSYSGVLGALFGYAEKEIQIDKETLKRIEDIVFVFGLIFQISILFNMMEKLKNQFQGPVFSERDMVFRIINEEIARSISFGGTFSICVFLIDSYTLNLDSTSEKHLRKIAKEQLINLILENIMQYDKLCMFDDNTYVLLLVGKDKSDAFYFMENIRQRFAVNVININNNKYFSTISCGIEQFEQNFSVEVLINRSFEALKIAQKSKNKIVKY